MTLLNDFKQFILRGNVVDLAVGVVIGAAFGSVVNALVADIITPIISIPGKVNFPDLSLTIGGGVIKYGYFLNVLISFLLTAGAIFFFVIRPVNWLMNLRKPAPPAEATTRECPYCISSIPRKATRCAFCTAEVPAAE